MKDPTDAGLIRLATLAPAMVEAVTLRIAVSPRRRWEVEARVLAGQTVDAIAQATGLSPPGIEWYERLFFDIRARLSASSYVMHEIIKWYVPDDGDPTERLWKFFAYRGGPVVLDALIRGSLLSTPPPRHPGQVEAYGIEDVRNRLWLRAMVLVHTVPVDESTAPQWVKLVPRLTAAGAIGSAVSRQPLSPNIQAMWETIPWWQTKPASNPLTGTRPPLAPGPDTYPPEGTPGAEASE